VTDKDQKPVYYDAAGSDMTIPNGLVIARSQGVYDLAYKRAGDLLREIKVERGR
jgi:hypothetical protein